MILMLILICLLIRKLNIKCIDNNSYEIFEGKLYFDGGIVSIDDGGAKLSLRRVIEGNNKEKILSKEREIISCFQRYQFNFLNEFLSFCNNKKSSICELPSASYTIKILNEIKMSGA